MSPLQICRRFAHRRMRLRLSPCSARRSRRPRIDVGHGYATGAGCGLSASSLDRTGLGSQMRLAFGSTIARAMIYAASEPDGCHRAQACWGRVMGEAGWCALRGPRPPKTPIRGHLNHAAGDPVASSGFSLQVFERQLDQPIAIEERQQDRGTRLAVARRNDLVNLCRTPEVWTAQNDSIASSGDLLG